MAAVSKTAKPSAPVVVGRFRSTKTGILPFGFRVLMNHGSFCLPVLRAMCSTLAMQVVLSDVDSANSFRLTRMQPCRHRYSSAPQGEPRLSSHSGCLRCKGLKGTWRQ